MSRYREVFTTPAQFRVKKFIATEEIVKVEDVAVTDDDVAAWVEEKRAAGNFSKEDVLRMFGLPKNIQAVKKVIARERVVQTLLARANITETERTTAEGESA